METPWSLAVVRRQTQALDPLALPLSCGACRRRVKPFTAEGVLFDWCPGCRTETLVPLRRPSGEWLVWKGAA